MERDSPESRSIFFMSVTKLTHGVTVNELATLPNTKLTMNDFGGKMFRLIILFGSCLALFTAGSQVSNAQDAKPKIELPVVDKHIPRCPPMLLKLEARGPIKITKEEIKHVNEYERYLKELNEWHLEALVVAERLEQESKLYPPRKSTRSPDLSPIIAWRRQIRKQPARRVVFPKSVINEMRIIPEAVIPPSPTETTLVLKLTKVSDRDTTINDDIYCDTCHVNISVKGPEVFRIPKTQFAQTADWRMGRTITLKPGESHEIELKQLCFGNRGLEGWSLRSPGKHQITVNYIDSGRGLGAKDNFPSYAQATTTVDVVVVEKQPKDRTIKQSSND